MFLHLAGLDVAEATCGPRVAYGGQTHLVVAVVYPDDPDDIDAFLGDPSSAWMSSPMRGRAADHPHMAGPNELDYPTATTARTTPNTLRGVSTAPT